MKRDKPRVLIRFLRPERFQCFLGVLFILAGFWPMPEFSVEDRISVVLAYTFLAGAITFPFYSRLIKYYCMISKLKKNGQMEDIMHEFQISQALIEDELRASFVYIFGRKSGIIIKHTDIVRIYQSAYSRKGREIRRELRVTTTDNKDYFLCRLNTLPVPNPDLVGAISFITYRNPNIIVDI